jgi:glycosyltransferase involved in cell wall biosynthesis
MHILIFEVNLNGHHSIYLEKIAEAHLELGRVVTVVVSEKFEAHPAINRLRQSYGDFLHVALLSEAECTQAMESGWGDVGREIGLWRIFQKTFRQVLADHPVDFVFLPYVDYCLNAIGLLGSPFGKVAWGGICMRPTFHFKACGVIAPSLSILHLKRLLFMRALRIKTLSSLFSIDELLVGYVREYHPALAKRLRYLPDPAELPLSFDVGELRQRYNIPLNAKVILVYGAIDERKGIFNLLDALEATPELCEWHALVVGRQSAYVREAFSAQRWCGLKQASRIHAMDEFVADEVEHHVLAMSDVVWVAYVGHYTMSGVIVRAGMYCKPVIACEEGLLGWYARNRGVGVTIDQSLSSVVTAIDDLSDSKNSALIGKCGYEQFKRHTWRNFEGMTVVAEVCK